ncbi:MAG: DUF302 domain-containing protein [bacterium]
MADSASLNGSYLPLNQSHYRLVILVMSFVLVGCDPAEFSDNRVSELKTTDAVFTQVARDATASGIQPVFGIDHSRLAEEAGETLDASKVGFYTNPETNSRILKEEIRTGLDLPYRIQAYYHQKELHIVYTSVDFIRIRHGLSNPGGLEEFQQDIDSLTAGVPGAKPLEHQTLVKNFGIIELESAFGFDESVKRLKKTILAEGDTVWFQDIDYQKQARNFGIELPRSMLLVFGAPAPGAKAMRNHPSIGLDAFAQKVLVYEQNDKVFVIYNEIPEMARLHYQDTGIPHYVIAYRLKSTLSSAIAASG